MQLYGHPVCCVSGTSNQAGRGGSGRHRACFAFLHLSCSASNFRPTSDLSCNIHTWVVCLFVCLFSGEVGQLREGCATFQHVKLGLSLI